jgi:hypothetical protein
MNALRMLYDDLPAVISIPKNVQHTHAEVVIMVLSTPAIPLNINKKQPASILNKYAGAWIGEPLIRESQGNYERREELV